MLAQKTFYVCPRGGCRTRGNTLSCTSSRFWEHMFTARSLIAASAMARKALVKVENSRLLSHKSALHRKGNTRGQENWVWGHKMHALWHWEDGC